MEFAEVEDNENDARITVDELPEIMSLCIDVLEFSWWNGEVSEIV